MKRFLLILVLMFFSINPLFAQRDTEHWIAPYYNTVTNYSNALYLSTDSVTPFEVRVYSNNTLVTTITISKGSPQVYTLNPTTIVGNTNADAFKVINKGLYLNGDKPFYCSLRIAQGAHGEIVTSKGKAGIGKEFFVASSPNTPASSTYTGNYNFTAGILATEDNTTVTVSWTATGLVFTGGTPSGNSHTFTLNRGQSFLLSGPGTVAANLSGFIGAKVVSDKPVSLTNGSCNGNFGLGSAGGSDAVLDQSVPKERLGNTFAIVKTKSTAPAQNMEGGIVIATEDNTQIFLNGSTTAAATINAGQWFRIDESNYITQPGAGTHSNMYISTSKNVYLYQFVAVGTDNATCGFNYIPPLNCFLPRKIDEIGKINEMPTISSSIISLKLNILTEAGADVTYSTNGGPAITPTAAQGPYPLTGNTNWVTYAIENPTGNLSITSTKAVTAGINGGYSTAGYGGYFAGFSSIPVIAKKTGECVPGITLEVDDSYETYQWFLNGVAIAGATQNTYIPAVAGNYTVKVTMGTCPPVTTPVYKVFACLKNTSANLNACATKVINPAFSFSTTQTPSAGTVTIITIPTHGTASVNAAGQVIYIPNPGYLGPDTIVYQFCGNAAEFVDCERVTLNLTVVPFTLTDTTIKACQYNGKGFFDLTTANVTTYAPVIKKFYPTLNDLNAATNEITNPTNYFSGAGFVYVKVTTNEGCTGNAKITLDFLPAPVVTEAALRECFLEADETKASFNLSLANVSSETPVTKKYYPTFVDASNGTNEILNPLAYISGNGTAYIRVYNSNGCYAIAKANLLVIPPKRSSVLADKTICIDAKTTLDAGPGYQSYLWSTGATTQVISGVSVGNYWVILQDNGCSVKQLVSVKKAEDPVISEIEISNNTATVHVKGGKAPYQYAVDIPTKWQDANVFTGLSRGQHTFYVKDAYNCAPVSVEVTVPNLINAITPNGDNKNDYIDYSELAYKENLSFTVYDRYGNKIFTGNKFNNYRWDGKHFDKKIVTGTYWYHINWNEPDKQKTQVKYTGWILVKNIN